MTIGEKILSLRKARGWSQEELADKIGVSRQAVSRWEADSAKPDADKIIAICDLFGVSADYLLREKYEGQHAVVETQQSALGKALRAMSLGESICGIISLFGIVLTVVMTAVGSSSTYNGSDGATYLFLLGIACIFVWPGFRFLKWTNS